MTHEQLVFDLPFKTALGREAFFVSESNALAVAQLEDWQNWPSNKLVLCGETGSGKTHLTQVWAHDAKAMVIAARDLAMASIDDLAQGSVAVEEADLIAGDREQEETLFHLHNLTLANGHCLLMTARDAPSRWSLQLPDLKSRVEGTQLVRLLPPDEALLGAVMLKQFDDRQLQVPANLLTYLLPRMDRSFDAVRNIVEALDYAAFSQKRPITRKLAAEILENNKAGDT